MVKFRLLRVRTPILPADRYRCGNHVGAREKHGQDWLARTCLKFSSNSIVSNLTKAFVNFVAKFPRIADNSFRPVCYGWCKGGE
jgi:hypothetical protein